MNKRSQPAAFARNVKEYILVVGVTLLAAVFLKAFVVDAYRIPSRSMENTLIVGDYLLVDRLSYGLRVPQPMKFLRSIAPFGHDVRRGDVIVFRYPGGRDEAAPAEEEVYVKRCAAVPGDSLLIRGGSLYINGSLVPLPQHALPSDPVPASEADAVFPARSGFTDIDYGPLYIPKKGDRIRLNRLTIPLWKILIEREGHTVALRDSAVFVDGTPAEEYAVGQNYYFVLGDNRGDSYDSRYWGFLPEHCLIGEALMIYWSWDQNRPVHSIGEKFAAIRWDRVGTVIR